MKRLFMTLAVLLCTVNVFAQNVIFHKANGEVDMYCSSEIDSIAFVPKSEQEDLFNGHEYVDLGLPSGLLWATRNIGADNPEDYGYYIMWGYTEDCSNLHCTRANCRTLGLELTEISGNPSYDAARAMWGGSWRMPTLEEMQEIVNNCTWTWRTINGSKGYLVTGTNGNSIFFPAAGSLVDRSPWCPNQVGYYWTSTSNDADYAYCLDYVSSSIGVNAYHGRHEGRIIRPVASKTLVEEVTLEAPALLDFDAKGSSQTIEITCNSSWTISTSASWLTFSVSNGYGNGSIVVTASSNNDTTVRTTTITLKAGTLTKSISVTQTAKVHEYVDLGLPSGLKWAKCNIGAENPEDYGYYYQWGETMPNTGGRNYNVTMSDFSGNVEYDAATANWGGSWRVPTFAEMTELCSNCEWEKTTLNGVDGRKVTGPNGNSIFFPSAGYCEGDSVLRAGEWAYYQTSTPYNIWGCYILCSLVGSQMHGYCASTSRSGAFPIRPVSN